MKIKFQGRKSTVIDGPAEPHRGLGRIAAP